MIASVASSFATLLRQHRIAAGLSQEELADRAGLSARAISDLERGVHRVPYRATMHLLSSALALTDQSQAAFAGSVRRQRGSPKTASTDLASASTFESVAEPIALDEVHAATSDRRIPLAPGTFPRALTSFVGRERETAAVRRLLMDGPDSRCLVTLTGPPGIGKTRLALQVASELNGDISDAAWFIPLASIRDPGLLAAVIAQALGVHEATDQPFLERLIAFLTPRSALLVLDNFEQILAAAPIVLRCSPNAHG